MVRVEPVTPAWADALAEGDDVFARRFGVPVEPGWDGFPEVVPFLVRSSRAGPATWGPHLFFDDDGVLVGNGGWKGEPVDGVAEIGYAVAPARRNQGIAGAAVRELVARGRAAGLRAVLAHTLAEPSASTSVLSGCGFRRVGDGVDPEHGQVWRWELRIAPP